MVYRSSQFLAGSIVLKMFVQSKTVLENNFIDTKALVEAGVHLRVLLCDTGTSTVTPNNQSKKYLCADRIQSASEIKYSYVVDFIELAKHLD